MTNRFAKGFPAIMLAFLLVFSMAFPCFAEEQNNDDDDDNDTRVTVYVAVGGTCGALAWFFAYQSGFLPYNPLERPALMNYTDQNWKMGIPMVNSVKEGPDAGTPYLEMIHIRF